MLIFFSIVFLVVVDRLFAAARFSADSPEVQEQAQGRFQAHVENPKEGKALPSEYAVPVYKIVLKTGGQRHFDQVLTAVYLVLLILIVYGSMSVALGVVFLVCWGVCLSLIHI